MVTAMQEITKTHKKFIQNKRGAQEGLGKSLWWGSTGWWVSDPGGVVVLPQSFSFSSLRPRWVVSPGVVPRRVWRRWTRGGYPIVRVLLVVCKLTTLHLGRDDRGKENTVSPP